MAKALKSIGCDKGVRVGIWSANCYEWILTQYATAKIGAIMVCVNLLIIIKKIKKKLFFTKKKVFICFLYISFLSDIFVSIVLK